MFCKYTKPIIKCESPDLNSGHLSLRAVNYGWISNSKQDFLSSCFVADLSLAFKLITLLWICYKLIQSFLLKMFFLLTADCRCDHTQTKQLVRVIFSFLSSKSYWFFPLRGSVASGKPRRSSGCWMMPEMQGVEVMTATHSLAVEDANSSVAAAAQKHIKLRGLGYITPHIIQINTIKYLSNISPPKHYCIGMFGRSCIINITQDACFLLSSFPSEFIMLLSILEKKINSPFYTSVPVWLSECFFAFEVPPITNVN